MLQARKLRVMQMAGHDEDVLRLADTMLDSPGISAHPRSMHQAYYEKAQSLSNQGNTVEAIQTLQEALPLTNRLPSWYSVALLAMLADESISQGDWRSADQAQLRSLQIVRDSSARDPARSRALTGRLLSDRAYRFQAQASRATDHDLRSRLARRAIADADSAIVILRTLETDNPTLQLFDQGKQVLAWADGAYAQAVLGRDREAVQRLNEADRLVSRELFNLFPYIESDLWLRKAQVALMGARLGEAARAAQQSQDACAENYDVWCEAAGVELLGQASEAAGNVEEAESAYRRAIALREIEWERARLQDWSASEFATVQAPYRGLTRVLYQTGRTSEAFATLDGSRARAMRDIRARLDVRRRLTPEKRARVDSLLEALHDVRLSEANGTGSTTNSARAQISRLNQEIDEATRSETAPQSALDVPKLQAALAEQGRSLVSYLVGDSSSVAFVVTRDTLVARPLAAGGRALQRLIQEAGGPWAGAGQAVSIEALHQLHEVLIRPLRDVLPTSGGLVIIPDGPLADLPFGALVERRGSDYASSAFLIRRQPISTDLAAALIAVPRQTESFDLDMVAFGRERFGESQVALAGQRGPLLSNLPYVPAELDRIRKQVGSGEVSLDDQATEAQFGADAGRARIVHVASHAEANPVFPLYSRIYLWDDPESDDDGVLHLFELQNLDVPADLVVLSGCSTAAGQSQSGEGTIGLQYGIRAGGAKSTVATLWPVDDQATSEIMGLFYEALASGASKDVALQRAQVTYLDTHSGVEASPFFWAAAVLSGQPDPIPLHGPTPMWPLVLGGLAVVAGGGGLAWRLRSHRPYA